MSKQTAAEIQKVLDQAHEEGILVEPAKAADYDNAEIQTRSGERVLVSDVAAPKKPTAAKAKKPTAAKAKKPAGSPNKGANADLAAIKAIESQVEEMDVPAKVNRARRYVQEALKLLREDHSPTPAGTPDTEVDIVIRSLSEVSERLVRSGATKLPGEV